MQRRMVVMIVEAPVFKCLITVFEIVDPLFVANSGQLTERGELRELRKDPKCNWKWLQSRAVLLSTTVM